MDQRGTPWKWISTIFKCKNEFPQELGLKKQIKKGVICLITMSFSGVLVLELSKIVSFLQIFADVSKNLGLQIMYMHLKVLVLLF